MLIMSFCPSRRHPTAVFFMVLWTLEIVPLWNGRRTGEGFWCVVPALLSTVCQNSSYRGMWWWRPRCTHGRGHKGVVQSLKMHTCFETGVTVCRQEDASSCFRLLLCGPWWHLMARHQTAPRLGRAKWRKSWDWQTFIISQCKANSVRGKNPYMLY